MKTTFLFLLTFFCMSIQMQAQQWAPIGMTWTYGYWGDVWDHTHHDPPVVWEAADTMTMLGHLCTIIKPQGMPIDISTIDRYSSLLTYEELGIVYLYNPMADRFETLYDFNKKVGETWSIAGLPVGLSSIPEDTLKCPITVVVDSIKTININGHTLKEMFISDAKGSVYDGFKGVVIEGIGHTLRPYPRNTCIGRYSCSEATDCYYHYDGLRCIDNGTIGFYDFKIVPGCDWIPTEIKEQQTENACTVFPNPAQGHITIRVKGFMNTDNYSVKITNLLGQTISRKALEREETDITTTGWHEGVYFYTLSKDQHLAATGKLIIE